MIIIMTGELLLDVKRHLKITWDDADTDLRIEGIVKDAIPILNHKLGGKSDYSQPGMEHTLFLNYCLYAWNDCINEFDSNYKNDIYQIRAINEVKNYEET